MTALFSHYMHTSIHSKIIKCEMRGLLKQSVENRGFQRSLVKSDAKKLNFGGEKTPSVRGGSIFLHPCLALHIHLSNLPR